MTIVCFRKEIGTMEKIVVMADIRLVEIHRGHVKVQVDDRVATINGEGLLPVNGRLPANYLLYLNTFKKWDALFEHLEIDGKIKNEIIDFLKKTNRLQNQLRK